MTEKKSLDFDFLDEKKADGTVAAVAAAPAQIAPTDKVNIFQYFKECFTNFPKFAKEHLVTKSPKYLILAIWIFGMGNAADRLTSSNSSNWGEVWAIILIGGILAGAVAYYIGGWFYHVRVGWSKGKGDIETARNIYTFSSLAIAITSVGALLFNWMAYGDDYFVTYYSDSSTVDTLFALLALAAIIYSIVISYRAVREVMHVEKGRAIGWFIVAPAIFYVAIFAAAIFK